MVPNEVDWFTGYFRRKGINENLSFADFETEGVNFSFFRYADVLLMYAEARIKAAELGGDPIDDTVIDAIDRIRCVQQEVRTMGCLLWKQLMEDVLLWIN